METTIPAATLQLTPEQRQRLASHGYVVIDDFLPAALHDQLLAEFKARPAKVHYQVRPSHYSHVFESDLDTLPRANEPYVAKFSLLQDQQEMASLEQAFHNHIAPILKDATQGQARYALYPGAVRLRCGDVYRAHQDAYAGIVGYTYFLNEGWCWDYGGILTYVRGRHEGEPIFPRSNRLLLRDESFRQFHFLNTIEQHCDREQYLVLGWADKAPGADSAVRGGYTAF